jgi:hypothetical protein
VHKYNQEVDHMSKIGSKTHEKLVNDIREYLEVEMRLAVAGRRNGTRGYEDIIKVGLFCCGLTRIVPGLDYDWNKAERIAEKQVKANEETFAKLEEREAA